MKWHYQIRTADNDVIHESKKGIANKGFDNPVAAAKDGDLIMNMKYEGRTDCYVHVFPEESIPGIQRGEFYVTTGTSGIYATTDKPELDKAARKAALLAFPVEKGAVTGGPLEVMKRAIFEVGYITGVTIVGERIESLLNQSFEGWSEDSINGYKTAMQSILEHVPTSGKLFNWSDMWTAWYNASFMEKSETDSEHFDEFMKEQFDFIVPREQHDGPRGY